MNRLGGRARERTARMARKDGKQVVSLRCIEMNGEAIVECEVYPVSGLQVEPLRPGPYRFQTPDAAGAFIDEAMRALTYLGCETA